VSFTEASAFTRFSPTPPSVKLVTEVLLAARQAGLHKRRCGQIHCQSKEEQSKGRHPLRVQPHDADCVHALHASALAAAGFCVLGQPQPDREDMRAMSRPGHRGRHTQATQTATPRCHLGRRTFLLHAHPLE
jgi:hypothetical protein